MTATPIATTPAAESTGATREPAPPVDMAGSEPVGDALPLMLPLPDGIIEELLLAIPVATAGSITAS